MKRLPGPRSTTPMTPKISVRPAASMNSTRPYCTLLSNWIRKVAKSMAEGVEGTLSTGAADAACPACALRPGTRVADFGSLAHPAPGATVGLGLGGHADHLVFHVLDPAQINVLHRVVGAAHGPSAAWAVDHGALQRPVQRWLGLHV